MSASSLPPASNSECKIPESPTDSSIELVALPAALPDLTQNAKAWSELQAILNPPSFDLAFPEDEEENYVCTLTDKLMCEPVITADGHTYEREGIIEWFEDENRSASAGDAQGKSKDLIPNRSVKNLVDSFIEKNPAVRDSKEWYLPQSWIEALAQACQKGDQEGIKALVKRDRRLLVHTFDAGAHHGKTALALATAGPLNALETVIHLLEKREAGLALAALLQKNRSGHLVLHQAILAKKNGETLLRLMAWMGKALDSVEAPTDWPVDLDRSVLNAALFWSFAQKDILKMACLLRLGANPPVKKTTSEARQKEASSPLTQKQAISPPKGKEAAFGLEPVVMPKLAAELRVSPVLAQPSQKERLEANPPVLQAENKSSTSEVAASLSMDQARVWYQEGRDQLKAGDASGALALFTRSAEAGYPRAQGQLGVHYLKTDKARAIAWFEKAAASGHAPSHINLGLIYVRGEGVPKDLKRGLSYFKQAIAQKEDIDSQAKAAAHYAKYASYCQPEENIKSLTPSVT